jgi:hypothetical protein
MSNFTNISPANVTGLLSTKTPALIGIYNTIAARVAPDFTPMAFTVKHKKLQIVEAIDETLRNAGTTYEDVEFSLQEPTRAQEGRTAIDDTEQATPLHQDEPLRAPSPAEQAIAASAIKRLRKNGVADETIRSTLTEALSAPCTTEDDGTTSHGVATAGLAILDTPANAIRRASNPSARTTLLPTTVITSVVASNPKKPSGKSAARFDEYYTLTAPFTVADVLANTSITRADILWDHAKGFITFA